MAVDPTQWLTLFEVLEQTDVPYGDIVRLADEGLIVTRPSGAVVLYDALDVARLAATGQALVTGVHLPTAAQPLRGPRRARLGRRG